MSEPVPATARARDRASPTDRVAAKASPTAPAAAEKKGEFDQAYMLALYDYGYRQARAGLEWQKAPPGLGLGKE